MSRVVFEAKQKRYVVEAFNGTTGFRRATRSASCFAKRKARFIQPLIPARVIDTKPSGN